jgi:hypothetical protein
MEIKMPVMSVICDIAIASLYKEVFLVTLTKIKSNAIDGGILCLEG